MIKATDDYLKDFKQKTLSDIKNEKIKSKVELKRKEDETIETFCKRKETYYTSRFKDNEKEVFLALKNLIYKDHEYEDFKTYKDGVLIRKHEIESDPEFESYLDFLISEAKTLHHLDISSQQNLILYNLERFDIEHDDMEVFNFFEKAKAKHYKKIEFIEKEISNPKTNTSKEAENNNPHPRIFENGAFEIFQKWMNLSKDGNLDKRISFIFQKLKKEKKMRTTNFKSLLKWAYDNSFIDKKTYDDMIIVGNFLSPSRILTKGRLNLYDTIKSD